MAPSSRRQCLSTNALANKARAFGTLKARWRIVWKKVEQKPSTLKKTVIAACILHNICIEKRDLCDMDNNDADDSFDYDNNGRIGVETENDIIEALKDYVGDNL